MPMNKARKLTLVAAGVAALATAAAAAAGTNLSLVAYSTPKTVMGKIIQAWQQTPTARTSPSASRTAPRPIRLAPSRRG